MFPMSPQWAPRSGTTHSHVRSAAGVSGFGDGVHQLAADAEVAQLDVAVPVQEDVRRLYVWWERRGARGEGGELKNKQTSKQQSVFLPLWIIFKFSFKWLSAFTVCKTGRGSQQPHHASVMLMVTNTYR